MHNKSTRLPPLPGRPPPADDERGPARLALRALRTRVPGLGVSQPNGRLGTRRRLAPSETTVYYAESTDRQPPDTHVSEGTPAVIPDDRDFVIELTIHLCNLNCTPYWILACSSVT